MWCEGRARCGSRVSRVSGTGGLRGLAQCQSDPIRSVPGSGLADSGASCKTWFAADLNGRLSFYTPQPAPTETLAPTAILHSTSSPRCSFRARLLVSQESSQWSLVPTPPLPYAACPRLSCKPPPPSAVFSASGTAFPNILATPTPPCNLQTPHVLPTAAVYQLGPRLNELLLRVKL